MFHKGRVPQRHRPGGLGRGPGGRRHVASGGARFPCLPGPHGNDPLHHPKALVSVDLYCVLRAPSTDAAPGSPDCSRLRGDTTMPASSPADWRWAGRTRAGKATKLNGNTGEQQCQSNEASRQITCRKWPTAAGGAEQPVGPSGAVSGRLWTAAGISGSRAAAEMAASSAGSIGPYSDQQACKLTLGLSLPAGPWPDVKSAAGGDMGCHNLPDRAFWQVVWHFF